MRIPVNQGPLLDCEYVIMGQKLGLHHLNQGHCMSADFSPNNQQVLTLAKGVVKVWNLQEIKVPEQKKQEAD
jgi:hypothetical protein